MHTVRKEQLPVLLLLHSDHTVTSFLIQNHYYIVYKAIEVLAPVFALYGHKALRRVVICMLITHTLVTTKELTERESWQHADNCELCEPMQSWLDGPK